MVAFARSSRPEKVRGKRFCVLICMIAAALAVLLALPGCGRGAEEKGDDVAISRVPDVVGMTEEEATEAIEDAGLEVGEVTREKSDEVAEEVGLNHEDTANLKLLGEGSRSLSSTINEEGDYTLMEKVPDDMVPAPYDVVAKKMLPELIKHELEVLNERERQVIVERYGLDGKPRRKLRQIAEELGLTSERVRQVEKHALEKLRKPCESACLNDYL